MMHFAHSFLAPWASFFSVTAASAATLTGLMFVVITLVGRTESRERSEAGITAFSTPTVLHFCTALLISAILCAPWHILIGPALTIGLTGLFGVIFLLYVARRTRGLLTYTPDLEDWAWYAALPLLSYGALLVGAIALVPVPAPALFVIAGATLLLIFIGIRNAWDVVTFLAMR